MKTYIRKSENSKTGYELFIIQDDGTESVTPIESTYKDEPFTLILPENPANRKYFNSKKVEKSDGMIELTYKESIHISSEKKIKKPDEDYLTDEEKKIFLELKEKIRQRKDEEKNKKLSPIEKARLKYEKCLREYEALKSQSENQ